MRTFASVCALALLLSWSGASAQSDARSKRPHSSPSKGVGTRALGHYEEYLQARITTWYEECRKGWNAKSHMSERDYERTCLQMARDRIKFLEDDIKGKRAR
jgi:hypothetical protein